MAKIFSFSERNGYIKVPNVMQTKGMSNDLRNDIFNVMVAYIVVTFFDTDHYVRRGETDSLYSSLYSRAYSEKYKSFFKSFYANILRQKITEIPLDNNRAWTVFENYFDNAEWHEIYSLQEWFIKHFVTEDKLYKKFAENLNGVLEKNLSGYRLINNLIVPITDENELAEIAEAMQIKQVGIQQQLKDALQQLRDKNYRGSVKESISAVETFVRTKTGKTTLGAALSELEKFSIPNSLKQGFDKIYGWTCGPDGVRHAIMDNAQDVTLAEAKFMLVACSAFLNYLTMKF